MPIELFELIVKAEVSQQAAQNPASPAPQPVSAKERQQLIQECTNQVMMLQELKQDR